MADFGQRRRAVLASFALLLLVAGCSGGDGAAETSTVDGSVARSLPPGEDRPLPVGDEPEVLGPLGETEVEFETEDGLVQIGAAEVPDGVSDDFPIPDGLEIQLASQAGDDAGFSGISDLTFAELVAFFDAELPAAGYDSTQTQLTDGVVAVYEFDGPDGAGNIVISSAPGGGRSVLVTFAS